MSDPIPSTLRDLSVESTNHDELRGMFRKQVEHALEGDLRAFQFVLESLYGKAPAAPGPGGDTPIQVIEVHQPKAPHPTSLPLAPLGDESASQGEEQKVPGTLTRNARPGGVND